jgi:hypothetical protein
MGFQVGLNKKQDPISKVTRVKRAGGMAQAVEPLPHKCKTLSSNPSIAKKVKVLRNSLPFYIPVNYHFSPGALPYLSDILPIFISVNKSYPITALPH